jgi:hypothetical protein
VTRQLNPPCPAVECGIADRPASPVETVERFENRVGWLGVVGQGGIGRIESVHGVDDRATQGDDVGTPPPLFHGGTILSGVDRSTVER